MSSETVRLEVIGIRSIVHDRRRAQVLVGRREAPDRPLLTLVLGASEAHTLHHELHGHGTPRGRAMALLARLAESLGGQIVEARLVGDGQDDWQGVLVVQTADDRLEVPSDAGQALAASIRLGVPLMVDQALLPAEPGPVVLSGPIADFLSTLDFSCFDEREP